MFAAAFDRPEVVKLLVEVGAEDHARLEGHRRSSMISPEEALQEEIRQSTARHRHRRARAGRRRRTRRTTSRA
jgi:hypothetical protein